MNHRGLQIVVMMRWYVGDERICCCTNDGDDRRRRRWWRWLPTSLTRGWISVINVSGYGICCGYPSWRKWRMRIVI
jgi:hypothetical protein